MRLFYTPPHARVGDVIPFYEKGLFKPFYLKNWNAYWAEDRTDGWHMMTTTDHLHYCEQATGIKGGTGSVIKHDGVYHLFYCVFTHKPERQYICHAVSEDMQTWKPLQEETFAPDDSIYQLTDWRDPFVFYNEEEKCWWMLVCTQEKGVTARQGCVGLWHVRRFASLDMSAADLRAPCVHVCLRVPGHVFYERLVVSGVLPVY